MTSFFLKAKHWQLFLLMIGLPFLFQFFFMGSLFLNVGPENQLDDKAILGLMTYFPFIMILFIGVFFGWFWSMAIGLHRKIPAELKLNLNRFRVFFFIPLVYLTAVTIGMVFMFQGINEDMETVDPALIGGIAAIVLPLHLLSMFGIFHTLYWVAKIYKTAQVQRKVSFSDFAGEFFLLWFYFIGVWIIQPKVNEMHETMEEQFIYIED